VKNTYFLAHSLSANIGKNWKKHQKYHKMWYFFVWLVSYTLARESPGEDYSTRKESTFFFFMVNT